MMFCALCFWHSAAQPREPDGLVGVNRARIFKAAQLCWGMTPIGQKTKRLFTGPSTPELRPSIKPVLPAGIQQAPLPAVAAREHKIACILDFGFCDATVTPNG